MAEDTRPYRPNVGIALFNQDNHVFVGNRIDMEGTNWQMPQGGIDVGETPEAAAMRELLEETGTDHASIIARTKDWITYDFPEDISPDFLGGRFRGQKQLWFAMRFHGQDADIRLDNHKPEFSEWCWMPMAELADRIVPFKREIYQQVVHEFRHLLDLS